MPISSSSSSSLCMRTAGVKPGTLTPFRQQPRVSRCGAGRSTCCHHQTQLEPTGAQAQISFQPSARDQDGEGAEAPLPHPAKADWLAGQPRVAKCRAGRRTLLKEFQAGHKMQGFGVGAALLSTAQHIVSSLQSCAGPRPSLPPISMRSSLSETDVHPPKNTSHLQPHSTSHTHFPRSNFCELSSSIPSHLTRGLSAHQRQASRDSPSPPTRRIQRETRFTAVWAPLPQGSAGALLAATSGAAPQPAVPQQHVQVGPAASSSLLS